MIRIKVGNSRGERKWRRLSIYLADGGQVWWQRDHLGNLQQAVAELRYGCRQELSDRLLGVDHVLGCVWLIDAKHAPVQYSCEVKDKMPQRGRYHRSNVTAKAFLDKIFQRNWVVCVQARAEALGGVSKSLADGSWEVGFALVPSGYLSPVPRPERWRLKSTNRRRAIEEFANWHGWGRP